jgi:dihydropteroate synthase
MSAPERALLTTRGRLMLGGRPWLMGIVNATPDSFSDTGEHRTLEARLELAAALLADGAEVIDIGGESGVTNRPPVPAEEEIERVVPLISRVADELDALVSVDTYKPAVARAAIAAGAAIVNDVSGLRDPELAEVCADTGAGLVLMHTRAAPKEKLFDPSLDGRVMSDVEEFLSQRIETALGRGMAFDQLLLDPGPDFGKTPAQTVEALRDLERLHSLGRPLLLAVSRKDFIGALTGRAPRDRLAGTLAAVGWGMRAGVHMIRVHDVAATADFVTVQAALAAQAEVAPSLRLAEDLAARATSSKSARAASITNRSSSPRTAISAGRKSSAWAPA